MPKNLKNENEVLNPSATVPKYFHFATVICERFRSSAVGAQLPPLTELAERFSVSKQTINRSMRYLAERGFVKSERGRGTVVLKDLGLALGLPSRTLAVEEREAIAPSARSIGMVLKSRAGMPSPDAHLSEIEIVAGLQRRLRQDDFSLMLVVAEGNTQDALERSLTDEPGLEGFVFMIGMLNRAEAVRVAALGKPSVIINEDQFSSLLTCVVAAEEEGMVRLMEHLFALGHSAIAFLGRPGDFNSLRFKGYERGLREQGIALREEWKVPVQYDHTGLLATMREKTPEILNSLGACTAVVTPAPTFAQGLCEGLRAMGKIPGKDLSVACFGFLEEEWNSIADGHDKLTTVAKPRFEMGSCAAQALLDQLDRGYVQSGTIRLPTRLLIGTTTTNPPAGKA